MVDRRSLVMGGGAAALAAVAGKISPAAAAPIAKPATTSEHVQRVVASLDVRRGLVDLDVVAARLARSVADYEAAEPRDPRAADLYAWIQHRVTGLTGVTDPFESVVDELEQTRTLMAFGFAVHTQHQDLPQPVISPSMPVPRVMARLETDFFPALLGQIAAESRSQPAFSEVLRASAAELDRVMTALAQESAASGAAVMAAAKPNRWRTIATVMILTFVCFAQGSYSC